MLTGSQPYGCLAASMLKTQFSCATPVVHIMTVTCCIQATTFRYVMCRLTIDSDWLLTRTNACLLSRRLT